MIGDAVVASTGSASPTNFQEMVTWDPATYSTYEATNLGNVRFCLDSACATPLDAWLESCSSTCSTSGSSSTSATAWVNLSSHTISAGGTLTIYMVFYSTSTNFDDNYWGEAPTLSGTYGQYDNGANVFSDYGAFQGSSLPTGWSLSGAASYVGGTSNTGGVRLVSNAGNQYGVATSSKSFSTVGACFETSAEYNGNADDIGQGFYSSGAGTATGGYGPSTTSTNGYYASYEYYTGSEPGLRQTTTTLATASSQTMPTSGTNFLFMQTCATSGQITMKYVSNTGSQYAGGVYSGLTSTVTYTATISAGASTSFVGAATGGQTSYAYLFWDRIRLYPPGGVMPSTSFGNPAVGGGSPTVSDTLGDAFTLGVSNTVAVTSTSYYSYIWYATASSSGANTVTASFSSTVTGSISIYELAGYTTASPGSSTGSSTGGSTSLSVTSFTPATNSFVIGNAESASSTSTYTAGSGFTLIATCSSVYGCSEYKSGVGSATTVPMSLGASAPWVESAISFAPAAYQHLLLVHVVRDGRKLGRGHDQRLLQPDCRRFGLDIRDQRGHRHRPPEPDRQLVREPGRHLSDVDDPEHGLRGGREHRDDLDHIHGGDGLHPVWELQLRHRLRRVPDGRGVSDDSPDVHQPLRPVGRGGGGLRAGGDHLLLLHLVCDGGELRGRHDNHGFQLHDGRLCVDLRDYRLHHVGRSFVDGELDHGVHDSRCHLLHPLQRLVHCRERGDGLQRDGVHRRLGLHLRRDRQRGLRRERRLRGVQRIRRRGRGLRDHRPDDIERFDGMGGVGDVLQHPVQPPERYPGGRLPHDGSAQPAHRSCGR